ncbi:hypothetical protein JXA32_12970 [Candidatus Sumerlaeota bacterium]|nr:hypothetical protein [Candidatus Sumerlaeota bacterium]
MMERSGPRMAGGFNLVFYGAILAVLLASLGTLVWLKSAYEEERARSIAKVHDLFDAGVIKLPSNPQVDWNRLEALARNYENTFLIRKVFVSKIYRGQERIVYPWHYAAQHADWKSQLAALEKRELTYDGEVIGALYFQPEDQTIRRVRWAIGGLSVMLAITLIVIGARLWKREQQLSATTTALAEKSNEMIRLERLALAGQLTANIFHDIRKPVLNIKHEAVDLEEALKDLSGAVLPLKNIREQVNLFLDILRELNMEKFVRADGGEAEFVNVNELLERSIKLVRYEQKNTETETRFADDLPLAFALPYRLIQVFSNILLNAYQALDGGGHVVIGTRQNGGMIEALISDDGPGMTPEQVSVIFEPFYTTKQDQEGSGLGLYISREIIAQLGGGIAVESTPGEGTTFIVRVPQARQSVPDGETPAE